MSTWSLFAAPLCEALLLVAVHTYLGLHVLRRGIVFVDLALAQIAALGGLVAFLAGLEPGSMSAAVFSFVFAILGAALLAFLRPRPGSPLPHEALIGLVYAFAAALALLVMQDAPEGAEHLQAALKGKLLWVSWGEVGAGAAVLAVVGAVHLVVRGPLLEISDDVAAARAAGRRVWAWDLVFYGTFAVVVTHSVSTAGVLLVFVFLVAPAGLAMLIRPTFGGQLLVGWALGTAVCVGGMGLSYGLDRPAGPTIVAVYAGVFAVVGLVRSARTAHGWRPLRPLLGLLAAGAVLVGLAVVAEMGHHDDHGGAVHSAHVPAPVQPRTRPKDTAAALLGRLGRADPDARFGACREAPAAALRTGLDRAGDPWTRLALARCLHRHDPKTAHGVLAALRDSENTPLLVKDAASQALTE